MRAGPLSDTRVLERLAHDYVCTWVLAKHLPALAEDAENPHVRAVAETCHENYLYPVDSQVLSPAGELLDHICANDAGRASVSSYLELLDAARPADGRAAPPILYMEQPTGIEPDDYGARWPDLRTWLTLAEDPHEVDAVRVGLRAAVEGEDRPGAINLLAQLDRQAGDLEAAAELVERAIALEPDEYRHHLQLAMICYARLRAASAGMERWRWHNRTTAAYRATFELAPDCTPGRYYLAYAAQQAPAGMGGDPAAALALAREGVERGQPGFTVVVADLLRLQGDTAAALEHFDLAVERGAFKLNAFVAAVDLALAEGEAARAAAYAGFLVRCRPDSARAHVALGDVHRSAGREAPALAAYERALALDPEDGAALAGIAELERD